MFRFSLHTKRDSQFYCATRTVLEKNWILLLRKQATVHCASCLCQRCCRDFINHVYANNIYNLRRVNAICKTLKQNTFCTFSSVRIEFHNISFFKYFMLTKFGLIYVHYQLFALRPHSSLWHTADCLASFIPTDGTNLHRQLLLPFRSLGNAMISLSRWAQCYCWRAFVVSF